MQLLAVIHEDEHGYWAEVPQLPGCVSQGDTWDEICANIVEAAEGALLTLGELFDEAKEQGIKEPDFPQMPEFLSRSANGQEFIQNFGLLSDAVAHVFKSTNGHNPNCSSRLLEVSV